MPDGDHYVRRLATFIRTNEAKLAIPPFLHHKGTPSSTWLPFQYPLSPVVLSLDIHRLYYILVRLEALDLGVGPLDVHVNAPFHSNNGFSHQPTVDHSDVLSLASFRSSISAMASSLPSNWWNGRDIDLDLKYIYSCFTKLPAILIKSSHLNTLSELMDESSSTNALPLHSFKNLQSLECIGIDPRTFLGWDRLAQSLKSLKICRSGIDDFAEIFINLSHDGCVRNGKQIRREITSDCSLLAEGCVSQSRLTPAESPLKWAFLRYLSLKDNAITFFPTNVISCLGSLVYLDLSSNLLISVPPGLDILRSLASLDLSDNMIDSVVGIYAQLKNMQALNLSNNRLETICGLERLCALQRIDLRHNLIQESAEIGRLSVLPNVAEIWVDGNPFVEREVEHRLSCFGYFWREGKSIQLEGAMPNFFERRRLATLFSSIYLVSGSPVVIAGRPSRVAEALSNTSKDSQVDLSFPAQPVDDNNEIKWKKNKRVVHLGENAAECWVANHRTIVSSLATSDLSTFDTKYSINPSLQYHHHSHTEIMPACAQTVGEFDFRDDPFLVQIDSGSSVKGKGEVIRRRIETLRKDMGEEWLGVFSSQI
ncbi:hypothetical protein APHAL10511_000045 [Amanita phalloides]|nr:hypothetical protein APHAL10511_000045 [Amanita phalloides]